MGEESAFFVKLLLSFLIGGGWVGLATTIAQKLGSKVGGVVAGMPSTLLVGLLFVALTQGEAAATDASTVVPASLGMTCALMSVFSATSSLGLWPALGIAFSTWLLGQGAILHFGPPTIVWSLLIAFSALVLGVIFFEKILKVDSAPGSVRAPTRAAMIGRMLAAGTVVVITVLLARYARPAFSGVLSVFPVTMMSTLIITYRSVGPAFARAVAKTHMVSGVVTCSAYVVGVRELYPSCGAAVGTFGAYLATLPVSAVTYIAVRRWMR